MRWLNELSDFNYNIKYRPGRINKDADALSRLPLDIDRYMRMCTEEISINTIISSQRWGREPVNLRGNMVSG